MEFRQDGVRSLEEEEEGNNKEEEKNCWKEGAEEVDICEVEEQAI